MLKPARFTFLCCLLMAGCKSPDALTHTRWNVPSGSTFVAQTPPPPAMNSPQMREGIREILAMQAGATPQKMASARWTYNYSVFTYSLALGPSFTSKKYPQTARLFARLNALVANVNNQVKDHFKSPHPFQVDSRVKRFVIAVPGFDYPSYHSARCAVFEGVLSMLDPARRTEFHQTSSQVELDRVFAGEHFPYSILAGRNLGKKLLSDLMADPAFRKEVAALKAAEWSPPPDSRNSF